MGRWIRCIWVPLWIAVPVATSPAQPDESCMAAGCHAGLGQRHFVHRPVQEGRCAPCHVAAKPGQPVPSYHEGHVARALAPARGAEACVECHDPLPAFHADTTDADLDPCLRCHDPHGGDTAAELRGSEEELCLACHAREFEPPRPQVFPRGEEPSGDDEDTQIHRHGPLREGLCGPCHPAHAAGPAELLRGELPVGPYAPYDRAAYSACFNEACHAPELAEQEPTQAATGFRNGESNLHYRHVVQPHEGRSCGLCHAPHLASNPALIRSSMPYGQEMLTLSFEPTKLGGRCTTTCHIPLAYDRKEAIPSAMRVTEPEPASGTELP